MFFSYYKQEIFKKLKLDLIQLHWKKKPNNKQIKNTQQQKNYPFLPSKKTLHT